MAEYGHYPAIDIEASIFRAMNDITTQGHQLSARDFKQLYSIFQQNRDLISVGQAKGGLHQNPISPTTTHPRPMAEAGGEVVWWIDGDGRAAQDLLDLRER